MFVAISKHIKIPIYCPCVTLPNAHILKTEIFKAKLKKCAVGVFAVRLGR